MQTKQEHILNPESYIQFSIRCGDKDLSFRLFKNYLQNNHSQEASAEYALAKEEYKAIKRKT